MKLSLKQKPLSKEVMNTDFVEDTESGKAADNAIYKSSAAAKTAATIKNKTAVNAQYKKPRRVVRPRPQHATPLDTVDDDDYDDCWLPAYEDPRPTNKLVEDDWVKVKKPAPGR